MKFLILAFVTISSLPAFAYSCHTRNEDELDRARGLQVLYSGCIPYNTYYGTRLGNEPSNDLNPKVVKRLADEVAEAWGLTVIESSRECACQVTGEYDEYLGGGRNVRVVGRK